MELIADLIKLILPAGLVLYAMYLAVRAFIHKEIQQMQSLVQTSRNELEIKKTELSLKNKEQMLPIRLQAYERMCLFLERISPHQLILRLNNSEFSVGLFQQILIQEIRNEFGHNLSQQMYMSDEAWIWIKKAMEETILFINNSALELNEDSNGLELAKKILENSHHLQIDTTRDALQFLKNEIRQFF